MARHRASTGRPRPGWRPSAGATYGTAVPSPRLADRGRHREAQRQVLAWLALQCRPSRPHPLNAATLTTLPAWYPRMPPASAEGPAAGHRARENRIAPLPAAHSRASKDPEPATPDQEGRAIVSTRLHAYVVLSLLVGIRTGDARALRWDPVVTCVYNSARDGSPSPVPGGSDLRSSSITGMREPFAMLGASGRSDTVPQQPDRPAPRPRRS